ncbi:hypothetical protein M408DRAFT_334072 [Serendipita vermifera MAFF 305830]|uniref:Uncharacterized protein n=1 Tax=Serendipita vermifera MAFF 305830 TaxID=933852 RepID=A0A0C3ALR7_SERVB|nr:hypothetical protein M408DRAFT_334072 [Serendipita vermifera MAFF 305830]
MVTHWPGLAHSSRAAKIPSIITYEAGVMQACGEEAVPFLESDIPNPNVARWFKLHLHPPKIPRPSGFEIPELPSGVSVHRAYRDMIKYLMDNTQTFFEKTTPNGDEIWQRLREETIVILATPNGWDHLEQEMVRAAVVSAGVVAPEDADLLVRFVTEAEAAVHYALAYYPKDWLAKGTVFSVVDAGGSTVDITVYKCTSTKPLRIKEACASECVQAGGIFVNRAVERLLSYRLRGSQFDQKEIIRDMLEYFERELKPKFDGSLDSYQIRFGGVNDTDERLGIYKGRITLSRQDLKDAFDNAVDQIIAYCKNSLRTQKPKYILLVGGFGESPYLLEALANRFGTGGTQVISVGDYSRKAAAEGATIACTKKLVESRIAKATYGGCVREVYDPRLHHERKAYTYIDTDGKRRVDNVFHPWVNKGATIKEDFTHRLHYHNSWGVDSTTKSALGAQLGNIAADVYAWEGIGSAPRWCKDEKGATIPGMRFMCTLDADLSALVSSLTAKSNSRGEKFYRVDYDVCIHFGGTRLRASLEWQEGKRTRRGPVSVIPAEYAEYDTPA